MPNFDLTREREYYEQEALWNRPIDAANRNRIHATLRLFPGGVRTVLDLGSGQGVITNHLVGEFLTTAFDLSAAALRHVSPRAMKVQGSGLQLPFRDNSFDLVIASEVIEHFPDVEQDAILSEMKRVAKRFLLVGVPAEEDILGASVRCPGCRRLYHVNHHFRSYDAPLMKRLTGWHLVQLSACGGARAAVQPWLRKLGQRAGGTFDSPHALCPECALPYPVNPTPLASLVLKGLNVFWRRATGKSNDRSHWIALYSKEMQPADDFETGKRMALAAENHMLQSQTAFAFGSGLVEPGSVAYLVVDVSPGWNPLPWPAMLLRALRSRAHFFVAGNLPGLLLGKVARILRGGRVLYGRNVIFVRKDFDS